MKKLFITLILSFFCLTTFSGCGGAMPFNYDATYWQQDSTNPSMEQINEVLTYDVKVVSQTLANKKIVENKDLSLSIEKGTLTTTLTNGSYNGSDCYLYKTALSIKGAYTYKGTTYPFNDSVETETYFKPYTNNFAPLKTTAKCKSNTIFHDGKITSFAYDYEIVYSGSTAKTTYTRYKEDKTIESKTTKNYDKFNDGTFIDNDLILLMPRAITLKKDVNVSFSTIDVVSQSKLNMRYYGTKKEVKLLEDYSYTKNGEELKENVEVSKLAISITNKFSGSPLEVYYATTQHRQRLFKAYTALNDSMGYLEYSLTSISI